MWTPTPRSAARPGHRVERLVAQREAGVGADQAPAAGLEEPFVLGQPGLGALGPVAVGDLVGAHDPHAHLGAGLGDDVERAVDGGRGGVVVDDGRGPRLQGLDRPQQRRPAHQLQVEGGVEPPPHLVEDLGEARRRLRRGRHAPGQGRVQVVVGADQAGRGGRRAAAVIGRRPAQRASGRVDCHSPERSCRAAATAPGRGHQADLAHALHPVGRAGLGALDEHDVDGRHVLGPEDAQLAQGHVLGDGLVVGGEVLGQGVARGPCGRHPTTWPSHSRGFMTRPTSWAARTRSMAPVSRSITTSWAA